MNETQFQCRGNTHVAKISICIRMLINFNCDAVISSLIGMNSSQTFLFRYSLHIVTVIRNCNGSVNVMTELIRTSVKKKKKSDHPLTNTERKGLLLRHYNLAPFKL